MGTRETLIDSAVPVWGRMPQHEQGCTPLIREDRCGREPQRGVLIYAMEGIN